MPVEIELIDEQHDEPIEASYWIDFARSVLSDLLSANDIELAIRFVDENAIAELNEQYLSHVGPTDVLSFPIEDVELFSETLSRQTSSGPVDLDGESAPLLLGDLVICPKVAARQATEHDVSYPDEVALLITHGILHLIGMDHEDDDEAEQMEEKERQLLSRHHGLHKDGDRS